MLFAPILSSAQLNIDLQSVVTFDAFGLNDIWGYYDSTGNEYALVGGVTGFSIVDVTDPENPEKLHKIPGDTTTWRDIKTWNDRAYVTSDSKGQGLLIVNLSMLPDSIEHHYWTGIVSDSTEYRIAHNLYIDENGFAYLFGSNVLNGGAIILSLDNPDTPQVVGIYDERYCHDGMVQNDVMYTSEIRDGTFSIVDVSDKSDPIVLGRQITPNDFTHNCWASADGNTLFTTDERKNAFVASYDIADPGDIEELDRYQSSPSDSVIPHNVHVFGDHLVTSYYADGVTIVDATRPSNMVEVGAYDTSPFPSEPGFSGCWGAYPYLPSRILLATDRREGLFVLSPEYKRAAYLEGTIVDDSTGAGLPNVRVEIVGNDRLKYSNFIGEFSTGVVDAGEYDIRFYLRHCETVLIPNVKLQTDSVTELEIRMKCDFPPVVPTGLNIALDHLQNPRVFYRYEDAKLVVENFPFHGEVQVVLTDLNGRILLNQPFNSPDGLVDTILPESLVSGMYIAQISGGGYLLKHKFVHQATQ